MMKHAAYNAKGPMRVGYASLGLLVGVIGVWSVETEIAGAVISEGKVMVENNRQIVQHAEGGIVAEVVARDGDHVSAGDVLITLDDTILRSELGAAELQLLELKARRARLVAERDQEASVTFEDELVLANSAAAKAQIEGQRDLFVARLETFRRGIGQIEERILQTENQVKGIAAQLASVKKQTQLARDELDVLEGALSRGLTQSAKVTVLRREVARLEGEDGRLVAEIAQLRAEIAELEIEKSQLESSRLENAIAELRDIEFKEFELTEASISLRKRFERLEIRAPVDGVVFNTNVFGRDAVVQPAEPLLYIVPKDQPLIVEARIPSIHIDQVFVGQPAILRLSAFNQNLTPEVDAEVRSIAADATTNEASTAAYYRVEINLPQEGIEDEETPELLPGMPVEVYLRTEDRTPMSYFLKPLSDQLARSFKEG